MYKEVTLQITNKDNIEKHAYIIIYDNIDQLKAFYDKIGVVFEKEASFVFKNIDDDNKAYMIRTKGTDTEDTINPVEFLQKMLGILHLWGTYDLIGDNKWDIGYVAEQLGITIKWK